MNEYQLPKCLQVIGLACIPVNDIPDQHPALARRPVAAAVLTMVDQDDGHRWINTICVSDARKSEIPLPHLLDKTLLPGVVQIASMADRMTLAMDAMSRRFFVEPALAELCFGETANGRKVPATWTAASEDRKLLRAGMRSTMRVTTFRSLYPLNR